MKVVKNLGSRLENDGTSRTGLKIFILTSAAFAARVKGEGCNRTIQNKKLQMTT